MTASFGGLWGEKRGPDDLAFGEGSKFWTHPQPLAAWPPALVFAGVFPTGLSPVSPPFQNSTSFTVGSSCPPSGQDCWTVNQATRLELPRRPSHSRLTRACCMVQTLLSSPLLPCDGNVKIPSVPSSSLADGNWRKRELATTRPLRLVRIAGAGTQAFEARREAAAPSHHPGGGWCPSPQIEC